MKTILPSRQPLFLLSINNALRLLLLLLPLSVVAKDKEADKKEPPKWDVNAAHGPVKQVRFTTDEGTWMDLDVSRDGKTIAFSLLGELYT